MGELPHQRGIYIKKFIVNKLLHETNSFRFPLGKIKRFTRTLQVWFKLIIYPSDNSSVVAICDGFYSNAFAHAQNRTLLA